MSDLTSQTEPYLLTQRIDLPSFPERVGEPLLKIAAGALAVVIAPELTASFAIIFLAVCLVGTAAECDDSV